MQHAIFGSIVGIALWSFERLDTTTLIVGLLIIWGIFGAFRAYRKLSN